MSETIKDIFDEKIEDTICHIDNEILLKNNRQFIIDNLSSECRYEQMAEEACEFGHASLKFARVLRGENPTPVDLREAGENLREEFYDVMLLCYTFHLIDLKCLSKEAIEQMVYKSNRWVERIKDAKRNDQE